MSQAKVDEWLHADKGSPWQHHDSGGQVTREQAGEILSRGRPQSPQTDINLTPQPDYFGPVDLLGTHPSLNWIPQRMGPDSTNPHPRKDSPYERPMHQAATGGHIGYDGGGMIDPTAGSVAINQPTLGGETPSPITASPMIAQTMQRYAQLPAEKLHEMVMMMGNSPQGQIARRALMQKQMMPQIQQQAPAMGQPMGQAMGGSVAHRDMGGGMLGMSLSQADPYWTRSEERSANTAPMTGYLHGATAGRADALKGTALSDSYILPAEEVAGLGEGNSLMGARVIDSMLNSGPHGIQQARPRGGHGPPHPPPAPREYQAKGGGVQHDAAPTTKVALSHGEYSMTPEQVMQFTGRPTLKSAHRVMDLFVMEQRKRHIKDLKGLEPPVGSKK